MNSRSPHAAEIPAERSPLQSNEIVRRSLETPRSTSRAAASAHPPSPHVRQPRFARAFSWSRHGESARSPHLAQGPTTIFFFTIQICGMHPPAGARSPPALASNSPRPVAHKFVPPKDRPQYRPPENSRFGAFCGQPQPSRPSNNIGPHFSAFRFADHEGRPTAGCPSFCASPPPPLHPPCTIAQSSLRQPRHCRVFPNSQKIFHLSSASISLSLTSRSAAFPFFLLDFWVLVCRGSPTVADLSIYPTPRRSSGPLAHPIPFPADVTSRVFILCLVRNLH